MNKSNGNIVFFLLLHYQNFKDYSAKVLSFLLLPCSGQAQAKLKLDLRLNQRYSHLITITGCGCTITSCGCTITGSGCIITGCSCTIPMTVYLTAFMHPDGDKLQSQEYWEQSGAELCQAQGKLSWSATNQLRYSQ